MVRLKYVSVSKLEIVEIGLMSEYLKGHICFRTTVEHLRYNSTSFSNNVWNNHVCIIIKLSCHGT